MFSPAVVWWEEGPSREGGPSVGDERDRAKVNDEPDVEAHRHKLHSEEAEKDEGADDDTPDVEAHRHKL
jgi:hypothetical protein